MIKRAIVGTLVLGILAGLVFGRDSLSYVSTLSSEIRDAVKSEIDVEFEVERARGMVEDIVPRLKEILSVVAEQQVEVRDLADQITDRELALRAQKDQILVLRGDLDSSNESFVYASRSYTRDEVKRDLTQRFDRFKATEDALERDRQILTARETSLRANEEQLEGMLTVRQKLEVELVQLEARLKTVQAAETVSSLDIDDSHLTRTRQLMRELNKQLDVKEALLDAEGRFSGLIPLDIENPDAVDVTEQIDTHFGIQADNVELAEVVPSA